MGKAGAVDHLRGKLPGFGGGMVGNYQGPLPGLGPWIGAQWKATNDALIAATAAAASPISSGCAPGPDGRRRR